MRTCTAIVERDSETGLFVGHIPGWPGAHSQGATLDELRENYPDTLYGHWMATLEIMVGLFGLAVMLDRTKSRCPAPRLNLAIANSGNLGKVCVGSFVVEPLLLNNGGNCPLLVTGITSSSGEFLVPQVLSFPLTPGGGSLPTVAHPLRANQFWPQVRDADRVEQRSARPHTIAVKGDAPSGKLAVTAR